MTRIKFKFKISYGAIRVVHFQTAPAYHYKKKRNTKPYKKKQPVKIQLKGLTILPEKTWDTENGEGERYQEIKN